MTTPLTASAQAEFRHWVHSQKDCTWLNSTFRIAGQRAINTPGALRALDWTIDDAERVFNGRKTLRFVPYLGGEPASGVAAHIHALLELPIGQGCEDFNKHIADRWTYFLRKQFHQHIEATVWFRRYEPHDREEQEYFMRYEGPTFSKGLEKVIFDHVRLNGATVLSTTSTSHD